MYMPHAETNPEKRGALDIARKRADVSWGTYLRHGIGTRLSILGERSNQQWLIYNPLIFAQYHIIGRENAPGVIRSLDEVFPWITSMADIGAGTGAFSAEAKRRGHTVMACEHSRVARLFARLQGVQARPFDLSWVDPIQQRGQSKACGPFDMALCLEVGEHLPPELGDRLVYLLSELSSAVVFSAASPGQGGIGHINEQSKEYWLTRFEDRSLCLQEALTEQLKRGFATYGVSQFLIDNVMVLRRAPGNGALRSAHRASRPH
jgi:SAM-dependent methyltransferase